MSPPANHTLKLVAAMSKNTPLSCAGKNVVTPPGSRFSRARSSGVSGIGDRGALPFTSPRIMGRQPSTTRVAAKSAQEGATSSWVLKVSPCLVFIGSRTNPFSFSADRARARASARMTNAGAPHAALAGAPVRRSEAERLEAPVLPHRSGVARLPPLCLAAAQAFLQTTSWRISSWRLRALSKLIHEPHRLPSGFSPTPGNSTEA